MIEISKDIVSKAAHGDIEAFHELYNATSGFLYNTVLRILANADDAQEVTQDVYLKIYRELPSFRFDASFSTWAYRIAVNGAINAAKARSAKTKPIDIHALQNVLPASDSVEETLDKQEGEEYVNLLLDMLNPEQRACMVLRNVQGLRYAEIAQTLGLNINTVRTRLKRARETLLAYLKKRGDTHELQKV